MERKRELEKLLWQASQSHLPTTERIMCYRRFRDICARYHLDPRSFRVPTVVPIAKPKRVRKLPEPKPAREPMTKKTVHANCTHDDSKVARAKCRRRREKAEEAKKGKK